MRIDAKGTIGQYPALLVRTTLRHLRARLSWGLAELDAAAGLKPGDGRALVKTLRSEGLIEAARRPPSQIAVRVGAARRPGRRGGGKDPQGRARPRGQRIPRGSSSH